MLIEVFLILVSVLVGLYLADFATGCFHWLVDNYGNPRWPVIGPHYIEPSHLHHDEDMYEFELSTLVTHLYIWTAVALVGLFFWLLGLMGLVVASACVFGVLTNVIHRWAHTPPDKNHGIVRALQSVGLFQSTSHHMVHHNPGSDTYYCLLTDHVNPVLEYARVWSRLERVFLRLGIRKNWWDAAAP